MHKCGFFCTFALVFEKHKTNYATGGGKMSLREICSEYSREIIFGSVLLACVVVSYMLAPLIPIDCFRSIIYPAQNIALITVLLINTWAMFIHSEGIRA